MNWFINLFKPRMDEEYIRDMVKGVLSMHPAECVFELDAVENITKRWIELGSNYLDDLEKFKECFQLSEIYCPHEGINRFKEYGMETV